VVIEECGEGTIVYIVKKNRLYHVAHGHRGHGRENTFEQTFTRKSGTTVPDMTVD
jgi:hypothetical protein